MAAVYASLLCALLVTAPDLIQDVQIRGNHRVPAETIKYRIQTKPGRPVDRAVITRDVRTLYALGMFENVRVEEQRGEDGPIVVFLVQERRMIRAVKYEGLKAITTSEITDVLKQHKVDLAPDSVYDPNRVRRAETAIKQLLNDRGHRDATISLREENSEPSAVSLTFEIDEGPTIKVQDITIEGNKAFSARELKSVMQSLKESGALTTFTHKNRYDELKLSDDIARIRSRYASNGYVRANIQDPVIESKAKTIYRTLPLIKPAPPWGIPIPFWTKQEQRLYVRLKVEENAQYRVGQVTIAGNKEFSTDTIRYTLGVIPGAVYHEDRMRKGLETLRRLYGGRGLINFSAIPEYNLAESTKLVNLSLTIDEDRKFYVNRISFSGNTTTRDKVIRRELLLGEGQVFNSDSWELGLLKLNQLGYFEPIRPEDVEMKLDPATSSVDIHLKVKEKDSNRIGFTGGVSGVSGGYLGVNYSTSNFLGLGETMAVNLEGGTKMSQYSLSFTEPYSFSRPLTTSFSVFSTRYQYDQADLNLGQKRSGFNVASSYPLRIFHRLGVTYQLDNSHISSVDAGTKDFFSTLATGSQNVSSYFTRRVIGSYAFNSVNHPNTPSNGHSFVATMESAGGPLGGNVKFYRPSLEFKAFRPVFGGRHTLAFRMSGSYVQGFGNTSVPFYERFFMGGDFDLRAFDYRSVSPIALIRRTAADGTNYDDIVRVGGDTQALFNFEYRIPIAKPITLAPFVDVGNSWVLNSKTLQRSIAGTLEDVRFLPGTNSGFRVSTGLELQITMPVINLPFRFILGFNPSRTNQSYMGPSGPLSVHDPARGFRFTIGKTF